MSEQGGAVTGWMRSLDLNGSEGQACWRTHDLLGGEGSITLAWSPEAVKASRTIAMPGEEQQIQWHVHMQRRDGRWRCVEASEPLGVAGWRKRVREEIRQMAVPARASTASFSSHGAGAAHTASSQGSSQSLHGHSVDQEDAAGHDHRRPEARRLGKRSFEQVRSGPVGEQAEAAKPRKISARA